MGFASCLVLSFLFLCRCCESVTVLFDPLRFYSCVRNRNNGTRHVSENAPHMANKQKKKARDKGSMDTLQDTLAWYSIPHERNGAVLRVDICAAGRTRSDVLGLLHALAESTGAALVVHPQPPTVCGMLLVSLIPAPVLQGRAAARLLTNA